MFHMMLVNNELKNDQWPNKLIFSKQVSENVQEKKKQLTKILDTDKRINQGFYFLFSETIVTFILQLIKTCWELHSVNCFLSCKHNVTIKYEQ